MKATKFETGKLYGNDLTIEVLKRTEKTITIKTNAWGVTRVKIREYTQGVEGISFKAWFITANENFDFEVAREISMYNAYHR